MTRSARVAHVTNEIDLGGRPRVGRNLSRLGPRQGCGRDGQRDDLLLAGRCGCTVPHAADLTDPSVDVIHAAALPVVVGPVDGTAVGNVVVLARARTAAVSVEAIRTGRAASAAVRRSETA